MQAIIYNLLLMYENYHLALSFSASLKPGLKRRDSCLVFNRLFISMVREDSSQVATHRLHVRLAGVD